jgi:hypothetical protein
LGIEDKHALHLLVNDWLQNALTRAADLAKEMDIG